MWTEASLLDAVVGYFGAARPLHLLRQVEVEDRRIDAIAVVGDERIGIEAKVSRTDFRRETDEKREPTWRASNRCVYLCPPGLIEPSEVPFGWGLWYATGPAHIRVAKEPMPHSAHGLAADLLSTSLIRRAAAVERRVRSAELARDPVAAFVAVSEEVVRLEGLLAQQREAVERERARAQDAAEQVAATLGTRSCATCGTAIAYTRVGAWRHLDHAVDADCEARRAEAERQRRMAATGAEYGSVPAPRITPAGLSDDR